MQTKSFGADGFAGGDHKAEGTDCESKSPAFKHTDFCLGSMPGVGESRALTRRSVVRSLAPAVCNPEVSLGKKPKPKLPLTAVPTVCEWGVIEKRICKRCMNVWVNVTCIVKRSERLMRMEQHYIDMSFHLPFTYFVPPPPAPWEFLHTPVHSVMGNIPYQHFWEAHCEWVLHFYNKHRKCQYCN